MSEKRIVWLPNRTVCCWGLCVTLGPLRTACPFDQLVIGGGSSNRAAASSSPPIHDDLLPARNFTSLYIYLLLFRVEFYRCRSSSKCHILSHSASQPALPVGLGAVRKYFCVWNILITNNAHDTACVFVQAVWRKGAVARRTEAEGEDCEGQTFLSIWFQSIHMKNSFWISIHPSIPPTTLEAILVRWTPGKY